MSLVGFPSNKSVLLQCQCLQFKLFNEWKDTVTVYANFPTLAKIEFICLITLGWADILDE